MDRPADLHVYDLGAGPGTLLQSMRIAEAPYARSWSLHNVDLGNGGHLPGDLRGSIVIANEVLDNVPFRWIQRDDDQTLEAWVEPAGIDWRPAGEDVPIASGEFPLIERAARLVSSILAAGPARVLMFDYGAPRTQTLADRGGWLRCYRGHERRHDPLTEPGRWDITTDVPLDQLPRPDRVRTQADFCRDHGLEDLVEAGRAYWIDHAAAPDTTALRMRSRIREAEALTDGGGLGAFWAAEWSGAS
jgi:SAM-dependent MidA family methyltransferase